MSSINRVGDSTPIQKITARPVQKEVGTQPPQQLPVTDKLELSGMSHLLKALKSNDIRTEKVAQIKAQIAAGTYEDDKKLDAAIDKLLDELQK